MADLKLSKEQIATCGQTPVCMRCGQPSSCIVRRKFTWRPSVGAGGGGGDGLLVLLSLLVLILGLAISISGTRRQEISIPLCERHRHHWRRYAWLMAFFSLAWIVLISLFVGFLCAGGTGVLLGSLLAGATVALVIFMIGAAMVVRPPIAVTEITDHAITLAGVADSFPGVGAVKR